jgi:pantoate--beta-alanine ligase
MEIINRRQRMSSIARKLRREEKTVGFVPTMGALHEGHLSLVTEARQMCDIVIVSVFVNPTQFGKGEDFERYPRDLTADAALLAEYNVDYVFAPTAEDIYPDGFSTYVTVEGLSETMEGEFRPGHFRGVATIVTILLNTVRPDFAFVGQKDAQQAVVIKRLAKDLGFDTEVMVLPTIREESGLALSSRNAYLSEEQKKAAPVLYQALRAAKLAYREGERNTAKLAEIVRDKVAAEPQAKLDYVSVVNAENLQPIAKIEDETVVIAVAARLGAVRLIDNTILNRK